MGGRPFPGRCPGLQIFCPYRATVDENNLSNDDNHDNYENSFFLLLRFVSCRFLLMALSLPDSGAGATNKRPEWEGCPSPGRCPGLQTCLPQAAIIPLQGKHRKVFVLCLCHFKILKIRILNIRMDHARQTKNTLIFKIHPSNLINAFCCSVTLTSPVRSCGLPLP